MSATIHSPPEPTYRPDIEGAFKVIDMRPTRDNAYLFDLVKLGVGLVEDFVSSGSREDDVSPRECRKVTNALSLAWAALGELLGVPRELVIGDED